jgi:hypothetical protein
MPSTARGESHELSKTVVREKGFEPLWPCGRQLLRLVRLPVPPLPRGKACK